MRPDWALTLERFRLMTIHDPLMTRREAATHLATTERQIDRLTTAGKLKPIYLGHSKRFRRSALDALLSPIAPPRQRVVGNALPVSADACELPESIRRPVRA